jgi:hypothetical protein
VIFLPTKTKTLGKKNPTPNCILKEKKKLIHQYPDRNRVSCSNHKKILELLQNLETDGGIVSSSIRREIQPMQTDFVGGCMGRESTGGGSCFLVIAILLFILIVVVVVPIYVVVVFKGRRPPLARHEGRTHSIRSNNTASTCRRTEEKELEGGGARRSSFLSTPPAEVERKKESEGNDHKP